MDGTPGEPPQELCGELRERLAEYGTDPAGAVFVDARGMPATVASIGVLVRSALAARGEGRRSLALNVDEDLYRLIEFLGMRDAVRPVRRCGCGASGSMDPGRVRHQLP